MIQMTHLWNLPGSSSALGIELERARKGSTVYFK